MNRGRVAVFGSLNMDLLVRTAVRPNPGETVTGIDFQTGPGGKGLNQAIAAARAGSSISMLGTTGIDAFGAQLLDELSAAGVDTTGVIRTPGIPTGVAQVTVAEDGENSIIVVPGANAHTGRPSRAQRAAIATADVLLLQLEVPMDSVIAAAQHAASAGTIVVLNPSPIQDLPEALLAVTDLLITNEHEARRLTGMSAEDPEALAAALLQLVHSAVVTLGSAGCVWAQRGETPSRHKGAPVVSVDTTGAGDTFAGFLAAHLSGAGSLAEGIVLATAAAGLAVQWPGASSSIPDLDAVVSELDVSTGSQLHGVPRP